MLSHLERSFRRIGAEVQIITQDMFARRRTMLTPVRLDVITNRKGEYFQIVIREDAIDNVELSVLEVKSQERHLVLLSRNFNEAGDPIGKEHFLCGHDERHLFVAAVPGVSSVNAAKASLKPAVIRRMEVGLSNEKTNRRKTEHFRRQGEWFFIEANFEPEAHRIRKNEPLVRGAGSKAHIAQFACRVGGEQVKVCRQRPNGLTIAQYNALIKDHPGAAHWNWRDMVRNPNVFVRGSIRHPDHATIVLHDWHRVLMNTERVTQTVAFLD